MANAVAGLGHVGLHRDNFNARTLQLVLRNVQRLKFDVRNQEPGAFMREGVCHSAPNWRRWGKHHVPETILAEGSWSACGWRA
ncbi:MAG: hypothetical protein ACJ746_21150 [Bryobacteraceae bacterium]